MIALDDPKAIEPQNEEDTKNSKKVVVAMFFTLRGSRTQDMSRIKWGIER